MPQTVASGASPRQVHVSYFSNDKLLLIFFLRIYQQPIKLFLWFNVMNVQGKWNYKPDIYNTEE